MHVGRRIAVARAFRAMTQTELATAAKMAPSYICRVESGKRDIATSKLERLIKALRMTPRDFYSIEEPKVKA